LEISENISIGIGENFEKYLPTMQKLLIALVSFSIISVCKILQFILQNLNEKIK
jgi:hypothetical protein